MVVSQGHIHHGADDDVALASHGPLLYRVQPEDAALRRIDNGRGEQRAIDATIADGERAALEFFDFEFVLLCAAREVANGHLDFGKAQPLGVPQDRDHQALAAADSYADVIVIVIDDVRSANLRVELRDKLQRLDGSLNEEGHEAKLYV